MPGGQARGLSRARQGEAICRVQQDSVGRALQERVLSALRKHCAGVDWHVWRWLGWSFRVSWNEVHLEMVVRNVR